jgi:hypothetical protein
MHGFIKLAHTNRIEISSMHNEFIPKVQSLFEDLPTDLNYVSKIRDVIPNDARPRTFVILSELIRSFILDAKSQPTKNDIIDLQHTAMPVNCCDYVLLDGPWAERVLKMKQRISKAGTNIPIAKCFSKRDDGVNSFLEDLETFVLEPGKQALPG